MDSRVVQLFNIQAERSAMSLLHDRAVLAQSLTAANHAVRPSGVPDGGDVLGTVACSAIPGAPRVTS